MKGEVAPQVGNDHPTSMPTSAYKTADGYINVACSGEGMWKRLCELLGRQEMASDERFRDNQQRAKNRKALNELLNAEFAKKKNDDWIEALNKVGVPCGPIYAMDQVFADPQVQHLGVAAEANSAKLGRYKVLAQASRLSRTPSTIAAATPEPGEHTEEILDELGFDKSEIKGLRERGVV
jgi:crotonobetainyl-CoA:carnitine CoA-transferase CaiB-like acyl-CoA transferase